MNFLALSILTEVAAGSSLSGAARTLRISPMAATRQLSALEQDVGVRLVHRTTRAIALTAEGQAFLPHAQALLDERSAAYASVRPVTEGAFGLLRLTASVAFSRKVMVPMIADFMSANPAVKVDLTMTDDLVDLVNEGLDLAIRIANLTDSSLVARRLAGNPRLLLASPDYLERHGAPRTLADLEAHDCLPISRTARWAFRASGQPLSAKIGGRFSANSIEGLLQACVAGLGIANLSAWFVRDEIAAGRLKVIELADAVPEPLDVWAVYPSSRMVPVKVRLFIDALAARLAA
ncbi:DNA-binding transcriptional regulator, LysR family [Pseudoxanthobacter soli DSM 19599]|uniref:DNA-binding transcriptional regulator, LysR family n=1 Tax=Pseudoxanthobacter soli DSM 19599 TaxID=1123029 RepID=A0A1M7Z6W6_9HYPH|nr:LysR family transcriptional regulator [Pseudoxanthobacter soli]SHO60396.1 DNA-binding transcriptional regulator, LysR family [Pseudoxanthobacter soli DSM 19599]